MTDRDMKWGGLLLGMSLAVWGAPAWAQDEAPAAPAGEEIPIAVDVADPVAAADATPADPFAEEAPLDTPPEVSAPPPEPTEPPATPPEPIPPVRPAPTRKASEPDWVAWMRGRVEVGARVSMIDLRDDTRSGPTGPENRNPNNFLGSIWGLDAEDDVLPRLFVQVKIHEQFGVGLTYDSLTLKTLDWANAEKTLKTTDGDLEAWGPLVYFFARTKPYRRVQGVAELGLAWYFTSFKVDPMWVGGNPDRRFETEDTRGIFLALGAEVRIAEDWRLGVYWRRMFNADVDAEAFVGRGNSRIGNFPLEYDMYSAGVTWEF